MKLEIRKNRFHQNLIKYINGGCLLRRDILISAFSKRIPFQVNSVKLIQDYKKLNLIKQPEKHKSIHLQVEVYKGKNPHVLKMMLYLEQNLKNDLIGAYVHGSLGTYEEIDYSDFDALVILKNEVFDSPKRFAEIAFKLSKARSIMFEFDPLQHHGWFVLTEMDLHHYPDYYFTVELFRYAKSLFPDKGLELNIIIYNSKEKIRKAFDDLSSSIVKRLSQKKYPTNMYRLKSLLSQFMLLPSLYVQVRDKKGIFKKFSFHKAKVDFSEEDWSIMDEVSSLRENWFYEVSSLRKWFITKPTYVSRYYAKKYALAFPKMINPLLTDYFYKKMQNLVLRMQSYLMNTTFNKKNKI